MTNLIVSGGKLCRRISFALLILIAGLLAIFSISGETSYYSSWWMITIWGVFIATGSCWIIISKNWRKWQVIFIHGALLLILAGALVTHICSRHGTLHLSLMTPSSQFRSEDSLTINLPFYVTLTDFIVTHYPGTTTPMDYTAHLSFRKGETIPVALNKTASYKGYRFVMQSYDSDLEGVTFCVSDDEAGYTISYLGYLLFIGAMLAAMTNPSGYFRESLHKLRRTATILLLILSSTGSLYAAEKKVLSSLPTSTSQKLSHLTVFYNDRLAPFGTLEQEFCNTVTGSTNWNGYSSAQITEGFLFYFGEWKNAPLIKVESKEVREALGIGNQNKANYTQWFDAITLGRLSEDEISASTHKKMQQDLARFEAINSLVSGAMLKLFPLVDNKGQIHWYSPVDDDIPYATDTRLWLFVRKSAGLLNEYILTTQFKEANNLIDKIARHQNKVAGKSISSPTHIKIELFYNAISRLFLPATVGVFLGIILFISYLGHYEVRYKRIVSVVVISLLWIWVTLLVILRWIVSGSVPLASGFETMQFLTWICYSISLVMAWRRSIVTSFALIAGSLALLVAAIGSRSAMVTPLMPVLQSPLLSLHVVLVMCAYALMAITMLAGVMGLLSDKERSIRIKYMEQLMIYLAVLFLGAGIFIGAVWANVSWGRYWGWDPKEVWALITLLIYSLLLHRKSLPFLNSPKTMHLLCILSFGFVLFTYFGVNYLLSGLHSYT